MLKLHIRASASTDLAETLAYYAEFSSGLPDSFLEQLDIALALLIERPNIESRRFPHFFPGINLRT